MDCMVSISLDSNEDPLIAYQKERLESWLKKLQEGCAAGV